MKPIRERFSGTLQGFDDEKCMEMPHLKIQVDDTAEKSGPGPVMLTPEIPALRLCPGHHSPLWSATRKGYRWHPGFGGGADVILPFFNLGNRTVLKKNSIFTDHDRVTGPANVQFCKFPASMNA